MINLGDASKTKFLVSAWLRGQAPKNFAEASYKISKKEYRIVRDTLLNNTWIQDFNLNAFSIGQQLMSCSAIGLFAKHTALSRCS
jgi:hypothetical protein